MISLKWINVKFLLWMINESAKLCALRVLVPYVLHVTRALMPYMCRAWRASCSMWPRALGASCPTWSRVLYGLVPRALCTLFPYVPYCQFSFEKVISIYQQYDIFKLFETNYENIYIRNYKFFGIGKGEFKAQYNNHKKLLTPDWWNSSRSIKFIWNLKD